MANSSSTEKVAPPSTEHQHQPAGGCPHAVASTIIQRHRDNRQRFDSADWVMQMQHAQQSPQTDSPPTEPANVAQMIMDRHALKTCALVGPTPVKNSADTQT